MQYKKTITGLAIILLLTSCSSQKTEETAAQLTPCTADAETGWCSPQDKYLEIDFNALMADVEAARTLEEKYEEEAAASSAAAASSRAAASSSRAAAAAERRARSQRRTRTGTGSSVSNQPRVAYASGSSSSVVRREHNIWIFPYGDDEGFGGSTGF